ncbi:MAG: hypothetical protein GY941_15770 [Planctomycetes bacterium]|nr:hypothetical protein [Planctomycetota bacterium]
MAYTWDFSGLSAGDDITDETGWTKVAGTHKFVIDTGGDALGVKSDVGSGLGIALPPDQATADQYIQIDYTVSANYNVFFAVRYVDKDNWVGAAYEPSGSSGLRVFKMVAGVETQIIGIADSGTFPATLRLEAEGDEYRLYEDGVLKGTETVTNAEISITETSTALITSTSTSGAERWDNLEIGPVVTAALTLDSQPSSIIKAATNVSFVVSTPATAPTTGNTAITANSGADALTVTSVTGSDPYTITATCPIDISMQSDATGSIWEIEVDAETVDSTAIPLVPQSGWAFVNLVAPNTASDESLLYGYTGDAPVTGDQLEYVIAPTPGPQTWDSVTAEGFGVLSGLPTVTQTTARRVIQADGTVGVTADYVLSVGAFKAHWFLKRSNIIGV